VNFALFPVTPEDKYAVVTASDVVENKFTEGKFTTEGPEPLTADRKLTATVSVGDWFSHMIFRQLIPCLLFYGFTHKTSVFGVDNTHIAANLFRLFWVVIFCYFSFRTTGEWMGDTLEVVDVALRELLSNTPLKPFLKKDLVAPDNFTFNGSKHEKIQMLPRADRAFQI
jgi:hypothetical protein